MKKNKLFSFLLPVIAVGGLVLFNALKNDPPKKAADNAGLTLPAGFKAALIIDAVPGGVREMAPTPNGDLYIKIQQVTQRGVVVRKGINLLHIEGDKATIKTSFGKFMGSGMYLKNGYLYASSD
ncbi:MAG: sorbosone dehydrogenase, partial [Mucilaginibacter sp.]